MAKRKKDKRRHDFQPNMDMPGAPRMCVDCLQVEDTSHAYCPGQPEVMVDREGGMAAVNLGRVEAAKDMSGQMPAKVKGKHRWVLMASYAISDQEAAASAEGIPTEIGIDKLIAYHMGCWDCEEVYEEARFHPCTAGDEWLVVGP